MFFLRECFTLLFLNQNTVLQNADSSDIICLSDDEAPSQPQPSSTEQQLLEESRPSPKVLDQNVENEDDE